MTLSTCLFWQLLSNRFSFFLRPVLDRDSDMSSTQKMFICLLSQQDLQPIDLKTVFCFISISLKESWELQFYNIYIQKSVFQNSTPSSSDFRSATTRATLRETVLPKWLLWWYVISAMVSEAEDESVNTMHCLTLHFTIFSEKWNSVAKINRMVITEACFYAVFKRSILVYQEENWYWVV